MNRRKTTSRGTSPAMKINHQPPRLLIVHIAVPSWANICPNLCEALQNFFSIACSLMGPSRMSLFSLYTVQNQHECVLPFVQVRGNFIRLQACISELRMLQVEGCHRPPHTLLPLAVEDGLQQFKQYSSHMGSSAAQPRSSLEITVLTSQPGKEVVKELEEGLKDINLLSVRRLQVVEVTKGIQEHTDSPSPPEEPSNDESSILEADIVLETLDNDVVSMEVFFKTWLQNTETDQENIHLFLTPESLPSSSRAKDNPICLKCDLQERFLSPSLLPGTADGVSKIDDPKGDISTLYQMASLSSDSPHKLQVIKALKSSGICESLTYGLPFILRPTSCWQLDWDELETNQQHFHALCHCLLKRDWLLLARGEPLIRRPNQNPPACSFYVITPSHSLTLLVKLVATRELMLPGFFPLLSEDPPEDSLQIIESTLDSLELGLTYNPLQVESHLYSHLSRAHSKPQGRLSTSWASRGLRKGGQMQTSRARTTVVPLPVAPAPARTLKMSAASKASSGTFLPSDSEEEYPSQT
ncbi:meiosis 1 arrest protein isoform X1 [Mastomys coucha]|uniref:meiosis 1 arrest protein isoform X1 n=1 Tax=Mastomys coucha TaxID=35658 RepID=UPI00126264CB|nr:meiosis 1 arrest protein isoform X1 [Mastomys coucha]